jgi:MoCo/4Fe-4S cofactor protein with predicted Tat translocation signal
MPVPKGGDNKIDLVTTENRLASGGRRRFWRSLDELSNSPSYREFLQSEFPSGAVPEAQGVSRRDALKLMAASAALAGLTACTKLPTQKIVPYVRAPEDIIPGKPLFYSTAMPLGGIGLGVLVESHMGRPTKIEGNPDHPASLGSTDVFAQASLLTLYDPDRSQTVTHNGLLVTNWDSFLAELRALRDALRPLKGEGLSILTETVTSPALAAQIEEFLTQFPSAKWHQYEPGARDSAREGARLAFGEYANAVYRFEQADVILSLDADFLCSGPGNVRYARDFAKRRHVEGPQSGMNRLYVVESTPSNTGAMADHRLPLLSRDIEAFARSVSNELGDDTGAGIAPNLPKEWISAVARDLKTHRGRSLVLAGDQQPPVVHALAHAMNAALGNLGATVVCTEPLEARPSDQMASLRELTEDMKAGRVQALLILSGNPVYTAPADLEFGKLFFNVPLRVHLGLYHDETSERCQWHIPEAHFLESWGDVRAYDGTISIQQSLISPLYDGKTAHELLAAILGPAATPSHDVVKNYWKSRYSSERKGDAGFEAFWETSLHDGVVAGTALPEKKVSLKVAAGALNAAEQKPAAAGDLELVFRLDPCVWDGRFANNGWLQELPKPLTQLTWDNAALIGPRTAARLGISNEDIVAMEYQGRQLLAAAFVMPGHADDSVTLHLGYGRARAGNVGNWLGFNACALRTSQAPWFGPGLKVRKTGGRYQLATTQFHHGIQRGGKSEDEPSVAAFERELVRVATIDEFRKNPQFAKDPEEKTGPALTLYPGVRYEGYAWGMSIDLNRCTGCNACVVACQAENNIAVVGKREVQIGREMHWIRIDTYFRGPLDNPETCHEPVVCMQCENAPCEPVCPVGATVHNPEGLNEMVYNRCVGTRYCSNNCPYKVRHFNFKLYSDWDTPSLKLLRNPNVTVRSRGVMEKCTYCVQRINAAKIEAEKQDRPVRDGEISTACEAACPSEAIVFGNINDPNSRVSKWKQQSRSYGLLTELNTRPRTTYMAKLRNPNPEIQG